MTETESVTAWLARLKQGHSSAATKLWQHYVQRLVRQARRRLGKRTRRVTDEEDVVVSVFDAFLRGVDDQRFVQLDDRDDLWQILIMLTERKAIAQRRRAMALKRGAGKVRGESVFAAQADNGSERPGLDLAAREPTPAFAAEMAEQLQIRLDELQDPLLRDIAIGKLQGYTHEELATRLNVSLRTVERKVRLIRHKWSEDAPC
jgi:DNA-directed RNA polymerase specialized sigma24 family protein